MIVETEQMLSAALHVLSSGQCPDIPYKKSYENHPCSKWVRHSRANYIWTVRYLRELCNEYEYRSLKSRIGVPTRILYYLEKKHWVPRGDLSAFVNCSTHKNIRCVYTAYRKNMVDKWLTDKVEARWTSRKPPEWISDYTNKFEMVQYRLVYRKRPASGKFEKTIDQVSTDWIKQKLRIQNEQSKQRNLHQSYS